MAGFAAVVWEMEQYGKKIQTVVQEWHMGKSSRKTGGKSRLRMADDRCEPCESTPTRGGSSRRQPRYGTYKRGLNSKVHLAVDSNGMPVKVIVTSGTVADCKQAIALIDEIVAEYLFGDRAYDTNEIVNYALERGMQVVIPPKKNRIEQREYDEYLYKLRHLVENAFLHLKGWRGVATRYAKNIDSFLAAVQIRCIFLWAKLLA